MQLSYLLRHPLVKTVIHNFLALRILRILSSTNWVFYRITLNQDLSDFFLNNQARIIGLKEEDYRDKMSFLSQRIKDSQQQHDLSGLRLTLLIWLRQWLLGFSTVKLSFFLSFPYMLFKVSHYVQPSLKDTQGVGSLYLSEGNVST